MKPPPRPPILLKAVQFSLALNSLMVVSGVLSTMVPRLSGLSLISSIIALPPATLIGWMLKPKAQSLVAVAMAGVEALFCSIAFYSLAAWLVLRFWPEIRSLWKKEDRNKLQ